MATMTSDAVVTGEVVDPSRGLLAAEPIGHPKSDVLLLRFEAIPIALGPKTSDEDGVIEDMPDRDRRRVVGGFDDSKCREHLRHCLASLGAHGTAATGLDAEAFQPSRCRTLGDAEDGAELLEGQLLLDVQVAEDGVHRLAQAGLDALHLLGSVHNLFVHSDMVG